MIKPDPTRSLVSFLRRKLRIKGKSEHTGRGAWVMKYDCSFAELCTRMNNLIAKLGDDIVESSEVSSDKIKIVFSDEYFDPCYRTVIVVEGEHKSLVVIFSIRKWIIEKINNQS